MLSSPEAEQSVIAALLSKPSAVAEILSTMTPNDFTFPENRHLFGIACGLYGKGRPIDVVTVSVELQRGVGTGDIAFSLKDTIESFSGDYPVHMRALKDLTKRRGLIVELEKAKGELGGSIDADRVMADLFSSSMDICSSRTNKVVTIEQAVNKAMKRIEIAMGTGQTITGIPTGFSRFDSTLGGIQPGEQMIIGAPPSLGKSALLFWIGWGAAKVGIGSILVNAEMRDIDVATRALAAGSSIPNFKLRRGDISQEDVPMVVNAAKGLYGLPIQIYDDHDWDKAKTQIRAAKLANPNLRLILVDYLQKMKGKRYSGEKRYEQVGRISAEIKELAGDLECASVVACQLSREGRKENKEPELESLRESGDIEQDADIVTFLHRYDSDSTSPVWWLVKKNRNGPLTRIKLRYVPDEVRFYDWVEDEPGRDWDDED